MIFALSRNHGKRYRRWAAVVACATLLGSSDGTTPAQESDRARTTNTKSPEVSQVSDARSDSLDFSTEVPDSNDSRAIGSVPPQGTLDEGDGSITVSRTGTVEMHVANLPLSDVLEALSIQGHRNIVATPSVTGTVTAHLYNVTFTEALTAVLTSNGAGFREKDGFIYVYTNAELANLLDAETPIVTRVFTLSFCSSTDALAVVTPMLSRKGSVIAAPEAVRGLSIGYSATSGSGSSSSSSSSGSSSYSSGTGSSSDTSGTDLAQADYLAVRDYPDVLEQVETMLRTLDVPPTQVLVEATILAVSLNEDNALGVDFTVVGGVDLELLGAMSNAVTSLSLGDLPTNRFEQFNSNFSTNLSANVPTGGLTFGVIKDQVGVFVRALEAITDTVVLANPKVLALNRQRAQVIIGRRDGFLTTTLTETQAIQNVEYLETGTQLVFRPFIGKNGLVRMELYPKDSVGSVINGLPSEQTTEVTTDVIIRDGQTILIGGLFREVTSDTRSQIPYLGNVPLIGPLFQGRRDETVRQEVIILLTVHIIKDQDEYARESEQSRQDLERLRVGIRRNMMWHGRERLAQAHFQKSLEHTSQGDTDKALWDIRMALHNNPRLLPAIELREKLLGTRQWDTDGSIARDFIHQLIRNEQGVSGSAFDRPLPQPPTTTAENEPEPGEADDTP